MARCAISLRRLRSRRRSFQTTESDNPIPTKKKKWCQRKIGDGCRRGGLGIAAAADASHIASRIADVFSAAKETQLSEVTARSRMSEEPNAETTAGMAGSEESAGRS